MSDTYEFDAHISVMAGLDSKAEAADKILEHCLDAGIAISLHKEGSLNIKETISAELKAIKRRLDVLEKTPKGDIIKDAPEL